MKFFKFMPLGYISILCPILLAIAVQPGGIDSLFTDHIGLSLLCGVLLLVAILASLIFLLKSILTLLISKNNKRYYRPSTTITTIKLNVISLLVLLGTVSLINLQVPAKIGFAISYSRFQQTVAARSNQRGKNIGLYNIKDVSSNFDKSESVYFLTLTYYDTATANYGFVYKPNRQTRKNPFGAQAYEKVVGDWYIFHGGTC